MVTPRLKGAAASAVQLWLRGAATAAQLMKAVDAVQLMKAVADVQEQTRRYGTQIQSLTPEQAKLIADAAAAIIAEQQEKATIAAEQKEGDTDQQEQRGIAEQQREAAAAAAQIIAEIAILADNNTFGDFYQKLERAEAAAALAYGRLSSIQRVKRSGRQMIPYLALLIAVVASGSLDMVGSLLQSGKLIAEVFVSTAWAASGDAIDLPGGVIIRQLVIPVVFLLLFVASFGVTLWDEFHSSKPRPISKDLNRAFVGFIIGQLKSILG
jgi:hypothetical protein